VARACRPCPLNGSPPPETLAESPLEVFSPLRLTLRQHDEERSYQFGRFRIKVDERLLLRDGKPLPLSAKALDTLLILVERKSQVVDKQELLEVIWPDTAVEENNLTQVISMLRRALGQDSHGRSYIETVHRRGYRFIGAVTSGADSDLQQTNPQHMLSQRLWGLHEGTQRVGPLWFIVALAVTAGLTFLGISRDWLPELFRARGAAETIPRNVSVSALNQGRYVIVLPFEVGSADNSLDYLAEGLAEALTTKLRGLPGVQAASLIEVAGPATRSLKDIARKSGANFIVQGNIRGTPENMQVTVVLHDASGHRDVWKEQFPAGTSNILSVEDQIFSRLAESLEPRRPYHVSMHSTQPTPDIEAYDLYLKGRRALRYHGDAQDLRASVSFFDEALKRDPRFALAYAGLANASLQMYYETKDSLWIAKALNASRRGSEPER
jgi:DNA-binding winged helix-turn-helix (wHTH) protein/TolB-like protein